MDRSTANEERIREVKRALQAVQEMQAEIARRTPNQDRALTPRGATELVAEARDMPQRSGLGTGVIVLIGLLVAAAVLASAGPWVLPGWVKVPVFVQEWQARLGRQAGVGAVSATPPPAVVESPPASAPPSKAAASGPDVATPPAPPVTRAPEEAHHAALPPADQDRSPAVAPAPVLPSNAVEQPIPDRAAPTPSEPARNAAPRVAPEAPPAAPSRQPVALPPGVPPATAKETALAEAKRLFGASRIEEARSRLMAAEPEQNADIAWALARTFDPVSIRSVGGPASAGDVGAAEKWYRTWYELGVASGSVSKNFRIERLIEAMRAEP